MCVTLNCFKVRHRVICLLYSRSSNFYCEYLSMYLCIYVSIYVSVCLSVYLSIIYHLSIYLICLSVYPSIHPSICPSLCLIFVYKSVLLSFCFSVIHIIFKLQRRVCVFQSFSMLLLRFIYQDCDRDSTGNSKETKVTISAALGTYN